jgi:periplasmic protein TonB
MFSGLSPNQPSARRWTALASFTLQSVLVTAALVFPMLYPQNLPQVFLARRIFVPLSRGEVRADTNRSGTGSTAPTMPAPLVVSRNDITFGKSHPTGDDSTPDPPRLGFGGGWDLLSVVGSGPSILPTRPAPLRPMRVSEVMEGNLIHRIEPQYPPIAKQIRLEGSVILKAIISREGNIERLEVASGPGVLALAAKEAVGQWKYRPYLLNGEPIEVETEITVNFVLAH